MASTIISRSPSAFVPTLKVSILSQTDHVQRLAAAFATPTLQLVYTDAPGKSYLGGAPRLPPGIGWPSLNGRPLGFLARLSLREMNDAGRLPWLPADGSLLFFYDLDEMPWGYRADHKTSFSVLYVADLEQPLSGDGESCAEPSFAHQNVLFRPAISYPSAERPEIVGLKLSDDDRDEYFELNNDSFGDLPQHQVGGFPNPIQNDDMERDCHLIAAGIDCDAQVPRDQRAMQLAEGVKNWRLLLQLDSDDQLGLSWGDFGKIYFWVEEAAAREGDCSNAWLILQCT
jgi:uncharacterized protein YwqG